MRGAADSVTQNQQLSGEPAQRYLKHTSDGQSLMQAVTAERLGLKSEERDPITGAGGAGYLGMSHDQNLNVWFDNEGATIRPTTSEKERTQAWQLGLRLQAYGYGSRMQAAPPIVAHSVKGTRIEYERRRDCPLLIANCRFEEKAMATFSNPRSSSETFSKTRIATNNLLKSAIGNRQLRSGTKTDRKESNRVLRSMSDLCEAAKLPLPSRYACRLECRETCVREQREGKKRSS
jgi:hypothetical protein